MAHKLMKRARKKPFAAGLQAILVGLMLLSFVLIAQQYSKAAYQAGFILLVAATLVQIVFGNVSPGTGFGQSMKLLLIGLAIVALVFALGIVLAPHLVNLGRR